MIDVAKVLNRDYLLAKLAINREPPKYRSLLRPLGALFDQEQARHVTLAEVEGGFIWHFFPHGDLLHPTYGMMTYEEVPPFVESLVQSRISRAEEGALPQRRSFLTRSNHSEMRYSGGYEDILRSLSYKFDTDRVTNVLVTEGEDGWLIKCCLPIPTFVQSDPRRMRQFNYFHESVCGQPELEHLIREVRSYRGASAS